MSPLKLYTLRHLIGRPLSTSFALLSMTLVSFTLATLGSIGFGLAHVFETEESPALVLVKSHNADVEWGSHLQIEKLGRVTTDPRIKRRSVETLLMSALVPEPGARVDYIPIRGIDPDGFDIHHVTIVEGRMPTVDAEELVVGAALYAHYPGRLAVGQPLEVHRKYKFTIVGVYRTGTPLDNELWTHRATLSRRQNDKLQRQFSVVYLETTGPQAAHEVGDLISHEKGIEVDGVVAAEWRAQSAAKAFGPLYRWLILINILVSTGVLLAATSQLTIVLLRRTSDMTVLRVLGFPLRRLAMMILGELQILALVGGVIGLAIAWLILHDLSLQASGPGMGVNFEPRLSPTVGGVTFGIMAAIGVLAALIPIIRLLRGEISRDLR